MTYDIIRHENGKFGFRLSNGRTNKYWHESVQFARHAAEAVMKQEQKKLRRAKCAQSAAPAANL